MTAQKIHKALLEAHRFSVVAQVAYETILKDKLKEFGCPETGACRRASMDLTRVLARLRSSR